MKCIVQSMHCRFVMLKLVSSLSVSHLERFLLLLYEMHCSVSALPLCNVKACLFAQCKSSREISVVV